MLSQSDFSGRVVNNDHFLYWGDIVKTNEEGVDFHIQVLMVIWRDDKNDWSSFQFEESSGFQSIINSTDKLAQDHFEKNTSSTWNFGLLEQLSLLSLGLMEFCERLLVFVFVWLRLGFTCNATESTWEIIFIIIIILTIFHSRWWSKQSSSTTHRSRFQIHSLEIISSSENF